MSESDPTILAVHSGALGDVILFGRLLEALGGAVTLVAGGEKGKLLAGMGVVALALDFDALPMHEVFADKPLADCALGGLLGAHDRLVSCFAAGDRRAELRLAALCGAGEAAFVPVRPEEEAECHLVEIWCDMLGLEAEKGSGAFSADGQAIPPARCLPIEKAPDPFSAWPVPRGWLEAGVEILAESGIDAEDDYVVIHPGAGSPDKCWPVENFLALARQIDPPAVFVLGPVEADRWSARVLDDIRREVPLATCPPLEALSGMLAGSVGFVGNDSGVSHLAAAVGAPTVALFGPTRAAHFAPLGPRVTVAAADDMSSISVARVVELVARPAS